MFLRNEMLYDGQNAANWWYSGLANILSSASEMNTSPSRDSQGPYYVVYVISKDLYFYEPSERQGSEVFQPPRSRSSFSVVANPPMDLNCYFCSLIWPVYRYAKPRDKPVVLNVPRHRPFEDT